MDSTVLGLKLVVLALSMAIWVSGTCNAADFTPADNYLINCGSTVNATVDNRVFVADTSGPAILTTPTTQSIAATTSPNSVSGFDSAMLYQTARIFGTSSSYAFKLKSRGRHFVRLHFFPFKYQSYDLTTATFKVSSLSESVPTGADHLHIINNNGFPEDRQNQAVE